MKMLNTKLPSLLHMSLVALFAAGNLIACGSDVVVADPEEGGDGDGDEGDGDGDEGDACPGCGVILEPTGSGECADLDEIRVQNYNEWRATPNELGAIRGTEWEGSIEGMGDAHLSVSTDQVVTLVVGEPFGELEADKGYPVGSNGFLELFPPKFAGEYPIHGASLKDGELKLSLEQYSPYDEWCALQTPYDYGECSFYTAPNESILMAEENCLLGDEDVDCGWLYMAAYAMYCECTSEQCFSKIDSPEPPADFEPPERPVSIVLNYDADAGSLSGFTREGAAVSLERVD